MAKKKKASGKRKAVKPSARRKAKVSKSRKAPNRSKKSYSTSGFRKYQVIVGSIRQYYREKGKLITQKEAIKLYHELKDQFKDVQLRFLEDGVAEYLHGKEHKNFPGNCLSFTWYMIQAVFTEHEAVGYFKPTDNMLFDLSLIGADEFAWSFSDDIEVVYRDLYAIVKPLVKKKFSPEPQLIYVGEKDSVYTWKLHADDSDRIDEGEQGDLVGGGSGPIKKPDEPIFAPDPGIKKLELEIEREKQKQKTLALELLKSGVISKEEAMKIMGI